MAHGGGRGDVSPAGAGVGLFAPEVGLFAPADTLARSGGTISSLISTQGRRWYELAADGAERLPPPDSVAASAPRATDDITQLPAYSSVMLSELYRDARAARLELDAKAEELFQAERALSDLRSRSDQVDGMRSSFASLEARLRDERARTEALEEERICIDTALKEANRRARELEATVRSLENRADVAEALRAEVEKRCEEAERRIAGAVEAERRRAEAAESRTTEEELRALEAERRAEAAERRTELAERRTEEAERSARLCAQEAADFERLCRSTFEAELHEAKAQLATRIADDSQQLTATILELEALRRNGQGKLPPESRRAAPQIAPRQRPPVRLEGFAEAPELKLRHRPCSPLLDEEDLEGLRARAYVGRRDAVRLTPFGGLPGRGAGSLLTGNIGEKADFIKRMSSRIESRRKGRD